MASSSSRLITPTNSAIPRRGTKRSGGGETPASAAKKRLEQIRKEQQNPDKGYDYQKVLIDCETKEKLETYGYNLEALFGKKKLKAVLDDVKELEKIIQDLGHGLNMGRSFSFSGK